MEKEDNINVSNQLLLFWATTIGNGLFSSTLKSLTVDACRKLRSISSVEGGISFLQRLSVCECDELSKIEEGLLSSTCLREVQIFGCPSLTSFALNPSIDGFPSLSSLSLDGCEGLTSIPSGLSTCTSLEGLYVQNCKNLKSIPEEIFGCLTCLKTLALGPFSEELEEFPGLTSIHRLHSSLKDLTLVGWIKLNSLPDQLQHLTALESLSIQEFKGVKSFPEWLENLSFLRGLKILRLGPFSEELKEFPGLTSINGLSSTLEDLTLFGWEKLSSLPEQLQNLTALKGLTIGDFNGVNALPEWLGNLFNLQTLYINNCPQLKRNRAEWSKLSHIRIFFIDGARIKLPRV